MLRRGLRNFMIVNMLIGSVAISGCGVKASTYENKLVFLHNEVESNIEIISIPSYKLDKDISVSSDDYRDSSVRAVINSDGNKISIVGANTDRFVSVDVENRSKGGTCINYVKESGGKASAIYYKGEIARVEILHQDAIKAILTVNGSTGALEVNSVDGQEYGGYTTQCSPGDGASVMTGIAVEAVAKNTNIDMEDIVYAISLMKSHDI